MNIIVVGLGSMGKRRIRLLRAFYPEHDVVGVDLTAARRAEAEALFGIHAEAELGAAIARGAGAAFVCTDPLYHADIITELLQGGVPVFSEINLIADGYARNTALAAEKNLTLFLSSTPQYRREIIAITERVRSARAPLSYSYHIGQYLPDWHPWENIGDFFVGNPRTNGCREIFGIEMPWMLKAFGPVSTVSAERARQSTLPVNFADTYFVTLRHEGGAVGSLWVDVVARKAVRRLEISGEDLYLQWDGTPHGLSVYNFDTKETDALRLYDSVTRDSRYSDNIIEDAYLDEMRNFFDVLGGTAEPVHTFEADAAALALIDRIEGVSA